ncbi:MAG: hypothetical protein ABI480_11345 [Chitinophagaceae bacterium]
MDKGTGPCSDYHYYRYIHGYIDRATDPFVLPDSTDAQENADGYCTVMAYHQQHP